MVHKYYQKHKEKLQKESVKEIKIFLKKEKKKSISIMSNIIRTFLKKKKKKVEFMINYYLAENNY